MNIIRKINLTIKFMLILVIAVTFALSQARPEPVSRPVVGEVMEGRSILVTANGRLELILEI